MSASGRAFITGAAGCGKTTLLLNKMEEDPNYGIMASTTGVSAVVLGTITINSLLHYYNTESLADSFIRGKITSQLARLSKIYEWLWIDEGSMLSHEALDILDQAVTQLDDYSGIPRPIKLGISGDVCQLPPIPDKSNGNSNSNGSGRGKKKQSPPWLFKASCWEKFAEGTTRLTKIWRQTDLEFLQAINHFRAGQGEEGAGILKKIDSVQWGYTVDNEFEGTTIMGKNDEVNNYNFIAHQRVDGPMNSTRTIRWGEQLKEWGNIPDQLDLKTGAYVMILANGGRDILDPTKMSYANGECGLVTSFSEQDFAGTTIPLFGVTINRDQKERMISRIERRYTTKYLPDHCKREEYPDHSPEAVGYPPMRRTYYDTDVNCFVHGGVEFVPLRLGYASTVHKTQGMTLDRVQMDVRGMFMGQPHMIYVAISRCKDPKGLRVVGSPDILAARCEISKEVLPWL